MQTSEIEKIITSEAGYRKELEALLKQQDGYEAYVNRIREIADEREYEYDWDEFDAYFEKKKKKNISVSGTFEKIENWSATASLVGIDNNVVQDGIMDISTAKDELINVKSSIQDIKQGNLQEKIEGAALLANTASTSVFSRFVGFFRKFLSF
jgi:hypothetical protein